MHVSTGPADGAPGAGTESRIHPGFVSPASDRADVDVILEGGPADIPRTLRVDGVMAAGGKIKIPRNNGYEHFEWHEESPGADGREPLLFRWTTRTRIAE
ncbi:hypothetical protein FHS43_004342 [Streptosporangium becharense]|uniref:Uncharacterized protein n=1 Tax=Streptosporangium becharense TaxID=1816182 RepID=A0A7W9MFA5_9ACTN|nr:hypothetical protein [Streptosporangium becharense]MBB5818128.1 hypothetical protein [Streptosporangium becharense]